MNRKPTYEELAQKVKDLENKFVAVGRDITDRKEAEGHFERVKPISLKLKK